MKKEIKRFRERERKGTLEEVQIHQNRNKTKKKS